MSDVETPNEPGGPERDVDEDEPSERVPNEQVPQQRGETPAPRRQALRALAVVGGCAYTGALIVPSISFLLSTEDRDGASDEAGHWFRIAKLDALKEKEPFRVRIAGDERDAFTLSKNRALGSVWLVREGDGVRALSAECPHLGCAIDATADGDAFSCPCHASRFSLTGEPEAGPSPRPMDELATRTVDGWVEVDFQRFRQGIEEKVET